MSIDMSYLEIILVIVLCVVVVTALLSIKHFSESYWEVLFTWNEDTEAVKKLAQSGAMDSLLDVDRFNTWFNSDKDKDIYAHPGIFLRIDKLSTQHIEDYIRMESDGVVKIKYFEYNQVVDFEDRIAKDWRKKQNE